MRIKKYLSIFIILILLFSIFSIGYSIWVISSKILIKPSNVTSNVVQKYLDLSCNNTYTYNGSIQLPTSEVLDTSELTFYYKEDGALEFTKCTETIGPKNAGTYEIKVEYKKNTGVDTFETITIIPTNNFVISPKSLEVLWSNTTINYDGSPHLPTATITSGLISGDTCNVTVSVDGYASGPTDIGTYSAIATTDNSNYIVSNSPNTFVINKRNIDLSWSYTTVTYDGNAHGPTFTSSGVIAGDDCTISVSNLTQTNAGTYEAVASLSGDKAHNYSLDETTTSYLYTINKKQISLVNKLIELDYSSSNRTFDSIKASINPSFSGVIDGDTVTAAINGMNDGTFGYGTDTSIVGLNDSSMTGVASSYNCVVGSTYIISYGLSGTSANNYYISYDDNHLYLKYKTAKIGSTFYTIEDALASSGNITLSGNPSDTEYVLTAFTKLVDLYSNTITYSVSNRTIYVPHTDAGTTAITKIKDTSPTNYRTSSCLYINPLITLNFSSSASLYLTAEISGRGLTGDHGTIMNNGKMIFETGTTLYSYGYLKGNNGGLVEMKSGSTAMDEIVMVDWSTAGDAMKIYEKGFPVVSWVANNISCPTKIYNGSFLKAHGTIYGTKAGYREIDCIVIGNTSSSTNCFFKPATNSTSTDYIYKYGEGNDCNSSIVANNQKLVSNDKLQTRTKIEIYGQYTDEAFSVKQYITFSTSTSKPAPIGYMDVRICNGSKLTMEKSSYLFMFGSELIVDEGGELNIEGSAYVAFDRTSAQICSFFKGYCNNFVDAKLVINGVLSGTGYIGGKVDVNGSNGSIIIENTNIPSNTITIKSSGAVVSTYSSQVDLKLRMVENGVINAEHTAVSPGNYISCKIDSDYGWIATQGDIVFDYNDGSSSSILKEMNNHSLPYTLVSSDYPVVPNRNYYLYETDVNGNVMWYTDPLCTNSISEGTILYSGKTLYIKWIPIDYTLSYQYVYESGLDESQIGKSNPIDKVVFNCEDNAINLLDVNSIDDLANYTLYGWYADSSCTVSVQNVNEILNNAIIDENNQIILYAIWKTYTPSFKVEFVDSTLYSNHPTDLTYVSQVVEVANQASWTPTNYASNSYNYNNNYDCNLYFDGWYLDNDCMQPFEQFNGIEQENTQVLYAKWLQKNSLDIYIPLTSRTPEFLAKTVYYIPNTSFTVPNIENYLTAMGMTLSDIGCNDTAYYYWECYENDTLKPTKLSAGNSCTLTSETAIKFIYYNRFKLTLTSNEYTYVYITYTGYYSTSDTSVPENVTNKQLGNSNKNANKTFYIFNDGTFTISSGAVSGGKLDSTTINGSNASSSTNYSVNSYNADVAITASGSSNGCFESGTLITTNRGLVPIENITKDDLIKSYNHITGIYEYKSIAALIDHGESYYDVINLEFSDGTNIGFIYSHGLFDLDLNKYVNITYDNYNEFVGHRFAKTLGIDSEIVTLESAEIINKLTHSYTILSSENINCEANGLLNITSVLEGIYNIFEYDENHNFDISAMQDDIAQYGLYTYDDFKDIIDEKKFVDLGFKYFKVAKGKGLLTEEVLQFYIDWFYHCISSGEAIIY